MYFVLNGNEPVYTKVYGFKNKGQKEYLDTATVIYAASFSKAVFACLAARLTDRGTLELDKPLYQYLPKPLPEYPPYSHLAGDERWKSLTARMCLSHTTGLPNLWWLNPHTGERDTAGRLQIYFTPGSRYAYSGEGLRLLQLVIETITNTSLQSLAQEEIFGPAGMRRTAYVWEAGFEADYAAGHTAEGEALYKKKPQKPDAAGSMFTTIADYARFISWIMKGGGLRPETFGEMFRPQIAIHSAVQFPTMADSLTTMNDKIALSYGLGWGLMKTPYGPAFFKEGHDDYWRNYNVNFPGKGISLIIMSNSANGEGIFKELLEKMIGDVFTPWQWEGYVPYNAKK